MQNIITRRASNKTKPVVQAHGYPTWLNWLSRQAIGQGLKPMNLGCLELAHSDGTTQVFGATSSTSGEHSARITVLSDDLFTHCLLFGDLGLAESYMNGWCEMGRIRDVIGWFLLNGDRSSFLKRASQELSGPRLPINLLFVLNQIQHKLRRNSVANSQRNISAHYDLGNQFFQAFLDPDMTYSSALYASPDCSLEQAQEAKIDLICKQLNLKPTDNLLEIGCGWGTFAIYAAQHYGCKVTAITISREQFDYANARVRAKHLQDKVEVQLVDYRNVKGRFDKIVSIEMIEAVGEEYLDGYIKKIDSLLSPDGTALLQMILCPDSYYEGLRHNVDFIQKHIFPGSYLPSLSRVQSAVHKAGKLELASLFDLTASYVLTLNQWQKNFNRSWSEIEKMGFDQEFRRKWNYYFEYCQAAFADRNTVVVQATYRRPNTLSPNNLLAP